MEERSSMMRVRRQRMHELGCVAGHLLLGGDDRRLRRAAGKAIVAVIAHAAMLFLLLSPQAALNAHKLQRIRQDQAHTAATVRTRERGEDRLHALSIFFYLVAN